MSFSSLFPGFGLIRSFTESSFVGQAVVVFLLLGSVVAWTVMLYKHREFYLLKNQNAAFLEAFRTEHHPLSIYLRQKLFPNSPSFRIYLRSCTSAARTLGMEKADISDLLTGPHQPHFMSPTQLQIIRESAERELADQVLLMERDLIWLATVTTIAPFLGLLGTVWGVMQAFTGMAITGAPTLSTVAPGISAALLTTVVGLLVAIPTVVGYNLLSVRLRNETVGMDNFVQELIGEFHHAYVRED